MTIIRGALALSLAVAAAPAALLLAESPAQAQRGTQVTGQNVSYVAFDRGSFRQQGNRWTEYDANDRPVFTFEETRRDDWSVYLYDRSRDVRLQLDLHRRKIGYAEAGRQMSDIYDIVTARAGAMAGLWPFGGGDRQGNWARRGETRWVNAGPIWNQQDAAMKCPVAAYAVEGRWTGEWKTTRQGQMSVCQIGW